MHEALDRWRHICRRPDELIWPLFDSFGMTQSTAGWLRRIKRAKLILF